MATRTTTKKRPQRALRRPNGAQQNGGSVPALADAHDPLFQVSECDESLCRMSIEVHNFPTGVSSKTTPHEASAALGLTMATSEHHPGLVTFSLTSTPLGGTWPGDRNGSVSVHVVNVDRFLRALHQLAVKGRALGLLPAPDPIVPEPKTAVYLPDPLGWIRTP